MCGTLHCQSGAENPTLASRLQNNTYTRIILKLQGKDHECKSLSGPIQDKSLDLVELVRDGTKCADNMVCMNQTCMSISTLYFDPQKCPSNHAGLECSGHGDCSNVNQCHCQGGWEGVDCSRQAEVLPIEPTPPTSAPEPQPPAVNATNPLLSQPGKETRKQPEDNGSNTIVLVFGMVSTVGGVFIVFAMMALCYRRSTVPKFESSNYPQFNPKTFKLPQPNEQIQPMQPPPLLRHENIDNRILSFTQLPAYR